MARARGAVRCRALRDAAGKFVAGPSSGAAGAFSVARWVVPVLAILLIAPLALSVPQQRLIKSAEARATALRVSRRVASLGVIALLTLANLAGHRPSRAASDRGVAHGGESAPPRRAAPLVHERARLRAVVLAAGRGRAAPAAAFPRRQPDFLFAQQTLAEDAGTSWQPTFVDYLFLSYTNATAFSPTDTLPLSHWAKLLMMAESAASLLLAITVVARAVNILQ